jgi:hypothetical protein
MVDRRFTEVELRRMMERARRYRPDVVRGRWVIASRHRGRRWEIIVEPDFELEILLVITAYPLGE